jgi:hypothetical protein
MRVVVLVPPALYGGGGEPRLLTDADDLGARAVSGEGLHGFRGRLRRTERLREGGALRLISGGDGDEPVHAPVDPRRGKRHVPVSRTLPVPARDVGVQPRPIERTDQRLALRKVYHLPLPRPAAGRKRGQDGDRGTERAGEISDPQPYPDRRVSGETRDRRHARDRLRGGVVGSTPFGIGPPLTEPRIRGVHQAGVFLLELPVSDPPPVHCPGAQILHHDVRFLRDSGEQVPPLGEPDVYAYVELIPVLWKECRGDVLPVEPLGGDVPHEVARPGQFDFDHLGPEFTKVIRRGGPEDPRCELEDPDAAQGFRFEREGGKEKRSLEKTLGTGQPCPSRLVFFLAPRPTRKGRGAPFF